MRGKVFDLECSFNQIGITPAYAGKRFAFIVSASRSRDHPRLCGEKANILMPIMNNLGSPPPMRGKATVIIP